MLKGLSCETRSSNLTFSILL